MASKHQSSRRPTYIKTSDPMRIYDDSLTKSGKQKADVMHEIACGLMNLAQISPVSQTDLIDEALACFQRALDMTKQKNTNMGLNKKKQEKIAKIHELLADAYKKKKDLTQSKAHVDMAMEIYDKVFGTSSEAYQRLFRQEHHLSCKIYTNTKKKKKVALRRKSSNCVKLGIMDMEAGLLDEAQQRFEGALSVLKMRYGPESLEVVRVREMMGDVHVKKGDYDEARRIFVGVLKVMERKITNAKHDARYERVVVKLIDIVGFH